MEKPRKILIVDDDQSTLELYGEIFKVAGFDVIRAKDGLEGLDIATKNLPDVIFSGIVMPRMDGFTMVENLRKNVTTSKIPVVIFSHLGREADRQRANVLGVNDFIVRDTTPPREVVARIKSIFEGGEYRLNFNAYDLDAPKLARMMNLNSNFQCLECGEKMILRLRVNDPTSKEYAAHFVCPQCGWEAH